MARFDAIGLFWEDIAPVKPPKKEKVKATPPDPVWLLPTYLPGLHEARNMTLDILSDEELIEASRAGEHMNYDIEIYPNYLLIAMRLIGTKKYVIIESHDEDFGLDEGDRLKLQWILLNFTMVGFNIKKFDNVISKLAILGNGCEGLWRATKMLIVEKLKPHVVLTMHKTKALDVKSIDMIEYTAGRPSLKKCAGRTHAPRMQDLPFVPGSYLSDDQKTIVRWYCVNDLDNTELVYSRYAERRHLREELGKRYNVDLMSSSDAQMAESIISTEIKRLTGMKYVPRSVIKPGTPYRYKTPKFIEFYTPLLQKVLEVVQGAEFTVSMKGSLVLPKEFTNMVIPIGKATYKFGLGGLHSQEKSKSYMADDDHMLVDIDATSYYPYLILNAGMTPKNLGKNFLIVYNGIVVSRVNAKKAGDIIMAEGLKITANGTFGKLGSMWSIVYAPDLLMQTTVTGQLSLLMYIEMMEHQEFEVISANTDGIVCKVPRDRKDEFDSLVKYWENQTGFTTEETLYKAVYSRDVNSYFAIYAEPEKQKGKLLKAKGAFNSPHPDKSADANTVDLKKNPTNEICANAVIELILRNKPISEYIRECKDIQQFVQVREVKGGGVFDGEFLGKIVRWVHVKDEERKIVSASSGNKVADSDGALPVMTLPDSLPDNLDYDWYEKQTIKFLKLIGHTSLEAGEVIDEEEDEDAIAD